jgi:hypothetical protein
MGALRIDARAAGAASALLTALLLGSGAAADEWDSASADDDGTGTSNVLVHGTAQVHDVQTVAGTADEDWYRLTVRPMSSYQMTLDGQTGDAGLQSSDFQRLSETGTVLENATGDFDFLPELSWRAGASGVTETQFVRVRDAACGTGCDFNDRYRIRFYETTYTIPRFNNTATQTTVLVVYNRSPRDCTVDYYLLTGSAGVTTSTQLPSYQTHVLDTATVAPNRSGSVRVVHGCGYGGLSGKAVAIEPATGFTFDTVMRHRAN